MPTGGGSSGGPSARAIEAGRAFVRLFLEDNAFYRSLDRVASRLRSFAAFTAKIGGSLVGAAVAALSPLRLAVDSIQELARQDSVGKAFGLTSEQFTGIAGVAQTTGEGIREFTESMVTLGKVASEGAAGKGEVAVQFFKDLNLNAQEFAKLRADEKFFQFFEAVSKVEDPLKKVRLLMIAFGEDGGKFLIPLLEKSPQELRRMAKGFAVSSADMVEARKAQLDYLAATTAISQAWRQVVVAVAPSVARVARLVTQIATPIATIISQNRDLIRTGVQVAAGVLSVGTALLALSAAATVTSFAFSGVAAIFGLITGAASFLLTPLGLITALVIGLGVAWATMTPEGVNWVESMKSGLAELLGTFQMAWGGIAEALARGDVAQAGQIAFTALKIEWAKVLLFWTDKWNQFKGFFVDGWHDAVLLVAIEFNDLSAGFLIAMDDIQVGLAKAVHFIIFQVRRLMDALAGITVNGRSVAPGAGAVAEFLLGIEKELLPFMKGQRAAIEKNRSAIEDELHREHTREQRDRDAARQGDKNALEAEIDRLKQDLQNLTQPRGQGFNPAFFPLTFMQAAIARMTQGLQATAQISNQLSGRSRGTFGTALASELGVGDTVAKKTLDGVNRTADGVEDLPEKLADKFVMG